MAKHDVFIGEFKKLLESIPDTYSLPQWQFAFRQVSYLMSMKILQTFPADVYGPDPAALRPGPQPASAPGKTDPIAVPSGGGGQTGGGHPSTICHLTCLVLGVTTQSNPPPGPQPPPSPV